jgi:hypothetical protein
MARQEPVKAEPRNQFSVLDEEPPLKMARWLRFAPPGGFGAGRRALFLALFTWVPIAVWALATGNVLWQLHGESLLQHYAVHVRCLVFIPLLILAEPVFYRMTQRYSAFLAMATLADQKGSYEAVLNRMRGLRSSGWPWLVMLVVVVLLALTPKTAGGDDALAWAIGPDGRPAFGGLWFVWVVRPLSTLLLLAWLWRLLLLTIWLWHMATLEPELVPTHPDRAGGIGFLEELPVTFSMVTFAMSLQIGSRLAHEILQHGARIQSFQLPLVGFAVIWSLLLLAPLLVFSPALVRQRRKALLQYSTLVGRQGRLVHRRWILGEEVGQQDLLDAPEIGPITDAADIYEAVRRMRIVPISLRSLLGLLLPMIVPLLALYALQAPLRELGMYLLKMLA